MNAFFILLSFLQGDFKSGTNQGTDQCLHVRELRESGHGSFQRVAGNGALNSLGAGNSDYSHKLDWKPYNPIGVGRVCRRVLPQYWKQPNKAAVLPRKS